jgi:hypothetical protein
LNIDYFGHSETIKIVRIITEREKQIMLAAFTDLENLVNQYRQAVMWLTLGNHAAGPQPTTQATRKLMKDLRKEITGLLKEIEAKTQSV